MVNSTLTYASRNSSGNKQHQIEFFDVDQCLVGNVRQAIARKEDIVISLDSVGEIYIFPERGEYFADVGDMEEFCSAPASLFRVKQLGKDGFSTVFDGKCIGRNLDELMWTAAYYASDGRLLTGCNGDDVVHLKHWPNMTRVPASLNDMRMAALLTRHPTSVILAKHLLKIPQEEINRFYSAARCAGLAVTMNRAPSNNLQELPAHKNRSLLNRIMSRIAGL